LILFQNELRANNKSKTIMPSTNSRHRAMNLDSNAKSIEDEL